MIKLTKSAADRALMSLASRGHGLGLRIGVKTAGCSGLSYLLEFVDKVNVDDEVFTTEGVKIVVDKKSLVYLDGLSLDFVKEGLNEGFKFDNPHKTSECGCGESFHV